MAFGLKNKIFDCRLNILAIYKHDLACRGDPACGLGDEDESQDHLEVCPGYTELSLGLGPMSPLTRVILFMKVQHKRKNKL